MTRKVTNAGTRIEWLSDLIRLEIALWDWIDESLQVAHELPLAFFETLYCIGRSNGGMRVGELAQALRVTVGGTSKMVDRMERAGLIRREVDDTDRRASRIVLTRAGKRALAAAGETYEAELATVLDEALSAEERRGMHSLVRRVLSAADERRDAARATRSD